MKNLKNKKGFTLVELVIVIAVIAILAAVLIPTFSNVVAKANASKELQQVTNAYKEALAETLADDGVADDTVEVGDYQFEFTTNDEGVMTVVIKDVKISNGVKSYEDSTYEFANGKIQKKATGSTPTGEGN